jgi:hypothetical protein
MMCNRSEQTVGDKAATFEPIRPLAYRSNLEQITEKLENKFGP